MRLAFLAACTIVLTGCGADTLFRSVPPNQSGVHFVNQVADSVDFNILNYLYFYDGGGVAIGDVSGDGLPDLYFTANQAPNRLYLNRGDLRFEDVTESAGVAGEADWTTGVSMADVNGDGRLDIYVSVLHGFEGRRGRNQLFINQGDGTFRDRAAEYGVDFPGYSTQSAFFDADADGDLDLFLLNHSTHREETHQSAEIRSTRHPAAGDRLYRNDGIRFTDVSEEAGIYGGPTGYGLGVVTPDLNGDGCPDIYVANDFHEHDYLYWNRCDGTFSEGMKDAAGHNSRSSMGVDAADIDNDGRSDVVVVDMLPDREDILKTSATVEEHSIYQHKVRLGYHHQYARNTLLWNRGEGRFSEVGLLAGIEATDWSWAALLADFDRDGWKDLFVTNGIWRRPNDEAYLAAANAPSMRRSLEEMTPADLALIDSMPHVRIANFAFRNAGGLRFEDVTAEWGLDEPLFSNGAAYADLDNDGDLDLVVNNINDPASIYENTSAEGSFLGIRLIGDDRNTFGVGAKVIVKADGRAQMQELLTTRGFQSSVDPRLLFGLADADTVDTLVVVWPDGRLQEITDVPAGQYVDVRQADVDVPSGEMRATATGGAGVGAEQAARSGRSAPAAGGSESSAHDYIAAPSLPASASPFAPARMQADYLHVENAFHDLTLEPLIPHMLSREGPALAAGDVNGDGLDDLFVGSSKWNASALLIQEPSGRFIPSVENEEILREDSLYEDVDAAFFDADGDGDVDLYVVTAGNEWWGDHEALLDRLYLNDGGRLRRADRALPAMHRHGSVVRPADYDEDGDIDLFVGGRVVAREYGRSPRSYLLRNDAGRFADVTDAVAPQLVHAGMVADAAWINADGDSALDLAVVGEWMEPRLFRQSGGQLSPSDAGFEGMTGWWTAVKAADLNGDGHDDLILGNHGLNSRLRARPEQPVRLYIADFDTDGEAERVLTSYRHGRSYPWAGREDMLSAFPSLARKYPTFASYGASTVEQIFGEQRVEGAEVLKAGTFASVAAINQGDGTFAVRELPIEAQIAPVRAVLADDFNGDGHEDVVLGGNFYGVTPAQGRYDASYGTFLSGSAEGALKAVENTQSGLWLEGEIRKLRLIQTSTGPVIVAARNADSLQFIQPQHGAGRGADSTRSPFIAPAVRP